jgi:hypothetical protein
MICAIHLFACLWKETPVYFEAPSLIRASLLGMGGFGGTLLISKPFFSSAQQQTDDDDQPCHGKKKPTQQRHLKMVAFCEYYDDMDWIMMCGLIDFLEVGLVSSCVSAVSFVVASTSKYQP